MKQKGEFVEVGRKDPNVKSSRSRNISQSGSLIRKFLNIQDADLKDEEIDLDLFEDLLTSEDINSEIDKAPVGFMLMSSLAAYAQERYDNLKDSIKKIHGELDDQARDGEIMGRATNEKVKAWIERNPTYFKMNKRLNRYQRQTSLFIAAARAFEMKSKLLQTKSANNRKIDDLSEVSDPQRAEDSILRKKKKKPKGKLK